VTRVARVTGLDRTGVEVACAVRPGGHVLQVTNGKGLSFAAAARGALGEAAELACAERVDACDLALASPAELAASAAPYVEPAALGGGGGALRLAWRRARDLATGEEVLVPAAAVHAPPTGGPLLGACGVRWTTNGMGAHPSWSAALLHALLEAVERDQLARALPEGFTEGEVMARRLSRARVARLGPRAARLARRIERRGFEVHLVDVRPRSGDVGLPVAAALLFDAERGPVPLTAGYCCRPSWEAALTGAILEAAQSRLTDIHGAREDVGGMSEADVERMRRACARAARGDRDRDPDPDPDLDPDLDRDPDPDPDPDPRPSPRTREEGDAAVRRVLHLLHRAGQRRVLALDLAPPDFPLRVAKVIVPGLLLSDLL
jgi:ribosomal protein S12 methylthiotransferase accessory factor